MNGAIAVLGGLVLIAAGLALRQGVLVAGLRAGGADLVALLPLLVLCFALAGLVHVLLPPATVSAWLSDDAGWRGIAVAWLAGAATPGGGPIGLSLAAGLLKSGAGIGVVVTYLTSISLLSFVRLPLEISMCGTRVAMLRYAVCAVLPPIAGALAQVVTRVR